MTKQTLPEVAKPSTELSEETGKRRRKKIPVQLPKLNLWEMNVLLMYVVKGESAQDIARQFHLPIGAVEKMIDKISIYKHLTDPDQARGKLAWLVNSLTDYQRKSLKMLLDIGTGKTGGDVNPGLIFDVSKEIRETMKVLQPKGGGPQVQVGVAIGGRENAGTGSGPNFEKVLRGVMRDRQQEEPEETGEDEGDVIDAEAEEVEEEE